ncbi:MAG TPA: hypothetical protein VF749_06580, partial [Candidatus Acidoferrum sp.]
MRKRSESFSPSLFTVCSQFAAICRDSYDIFMTASVDDIGDALLGHADRTGTLERWRYVLFARFRQGFDQLVQEGLALVEGLHAHA